MRSIALSLLVVMAIAPLSACRGVRTPPRSSRTRTIGPEGGTISLGNLELDVPPGALAIEQQITIRRTSDVPDGHIGQAYELEPEGLSFDPPVTARFAIDMEDLDPSALSVAKVTGGRWVPVPSVVDPEEELVMASISSFSTWGVVDTSGVGADADADIDADGPGDSDIAADADGDADADSAPSCSHAPCTLGDGSCSCDWTCDAVYFPVYCRFDTMQCDCDGDATYDCTADGAPMTAEACGDATCCFR